MGNDKVKLLETSYNSELEIGNIISVSWLTMSALQRCSHITASRKT